MPAHHLFVEPIDDIGQVELPPFLRNLRVKDDLKEQVSELFLQIARIGAVQGVENLVCFLNEHGFERLACLLLIPRAAPFASKLLDQFHQFLNVSFLAGH